MPQRRRKSRRYIDPIDFRHPVVIGGGGTPVVHIGWEMDWWAYHAECDKRDREEAQSDNQADD